MFIKMVKKNEEGEYVLQCARYEVEPLLKDRGTKKEKKIGIRLDILDSLSNEKTLHEAHALVWGESCQYECIYVMNDEGKTIDRVFINHK